MGWNECSYFPTCGAYDVPELRHLPWMTEKNHKTCQESWCHSVDLKWAPPKNESLHQGLHLTVTSAGISTLFTYVHREETKTFQSEWIIQPYYKKKKYTKDHM